MLKGDNIIEAYCPVCKRAITQVDIRQGWVTKHDGWTCICHLERGRKLLENRTAVIMAEAVARVIVENKLVGQDLYIAQDEGAKQAGLTTEDFEYLMKTICSTRKVGK